MITRILAYLFSASLFCIVSLHLGFSYQFIFLSGVTLLIVIPYKLIEVTCLSILDRVFDCLLGNEQLLPKVNLERESLFMVHDMSFKAKAFIGATGGKMGVFVTEESMKVPFVRLNKDDTDVFISKDTFASYSVAEVLYHGRLCEYGLRYLRIDEVKACFGIPGEKLKLCFHLLRCKILLLVCFGLGSNVRTLTPIVSS
ncbi:hypothetical protein [Vibrio barjaei]|uniref:hypothetical protein n=1 Tax=Vibrio barjaei TaxID=1676683 RepID=UPI0022852E3C|nr:hypothetical protein [Vibrio barjaei]MCY9872330.1 hypothetical protein [Vibrio barjaei]